MHVTVCWVIWMSACVEVWMVELSTVFDWLWFVCLWIVLHDVSVWLRTVSEWLCTVSMDVYCMSVDVLHVLGKYSFLSPDAPEYRSFETMKCVQLDLLTTRSMIMLVECSDNFSWQHALLHANDWLPLNQWYIWMQLVQESTSQYWFHIMSWNRCNNVTHIKYIRNL